MAAISAYSIAVTARRSVRKQRSFVKSGITPLLTGKP
jgi:hypothetical protein